MKISINAVLARCILFYFQYFLHLTLRSAVIFCFYWYLKKDVIGVKFGTASKQQFNELRNGKIQANRDQKSNLLFLKRRDQF